MKSKPFKMKNPSLAKAMKDGSPMQANYGSPAKIDLTKGFKKMYDTGKELYDKGKEVYDKLPKGVKNTIKDVADPNPYSKFYRMAREQSPTIRDLTDKPVRTMIKGKNIVKEKVKEMVSSEDKPKTFGK